MSRGPGDIERRLNELFNRAEGTDTVLTVADLCQHVFGDGKPTRAQRISVLRAAHRLLTRKERPRSLQITERPDRSIVFHDRSLPVRVWAGQITPAGVVWAEAEIISITKNRVNVRYQGEPASLDRKQRLGWGGWALWRGVYFVSSRSGFAARLLDSFWAKQYGHLFPNLLPLEQAMLLLGVPKGYTRDDILRAFRHSAKRCHPDHGGTDEKFRLLMEARDRLLASLGVPIPKVPRFTPRGAKLRYSRASLGSSRGSLRLGAETPLIP